MVKVAQQNKLIVIIGPTAAKKSLVAVWLARAIHGQIINGDAFQVYREINVGVNKPTAEILQEIPHHLVNIISYRDEWNIAKFQEAFWTAYTKITQVDHAPAILCGGSHLYIDCVLNGYDLADKGEATFFPLFNQMNSINLLEFIQRYDPESAQKIGLNNRKRLVRVATLIRAHNYQPKTFTDVVGNRPFPNPLVIMVTQDRQILYQKINARFDQMWDNCWLQEVQKLVQQDPNIVNSQAFQAIGYQDIANHLLYGANLNLEQLKQRTRNLAKHQLTWCRNKFPNKFVFDPTTDNFAELLGHVQAYLNEEEREEAI